MNVPQPPDKPSEKKSAREKVREMQAADQRRRRRNRLLLQGGVVALVLVVIAAVVFLVNSGRGSDSAGGSGTPANFVGNGITFGQGGVLGDTASASPAPTASTGTTPAKVVIYFDMQCPVCMQFESGNADQIKQLADSGQATVEYKPISFLDNSSTTQYSSRAGNAVLAVADRAPEKFRDYVSLLFTHQPAEGSSGLPDSQLVAYAKQVGVTGIDQSVRDKTYGQFLRKATQQALNQEHVQGTPTVLVNGRSYNPQTAGAQSWADAAAFKKFFDQAATQPVQGDGETAPASSN